MKEEIIVLENINITPLIKAVKQFKKGLTQVKDQLDRDGAIQRFEFTFELIWKTLKRILDFKGINVNPISFILAYVLFSSFLFKRSFLVLVGS